MYNISILSKCDDDKIRAVIIAAVNNIISNEVNIVVSKMKHGKITAPVWNVLSRQDI